MKMNEHRKVLELLPWYVNGTLPEAEHRVVESHVRECLPCRAALKDERRLAGALERAAAHDSPMEWNFARLMRRIEHPGRSAAGPRRIRALQITRPQWLSAAAAIVVAVVAGATFWLAGLDGPAPSSRYTTATDAVRADAPMLDIVFAEGATQADIRDVLASIHGTIVDGPSDVGRYTVRLSVSKPSDADLEALIARLDKDARVRFAGRSFIGAGKQSDQ